MQRIYLIGFMGAGKSTIGRVFAERYGYLFIDLDQYIESKFFKSIGQLFDEQGEEVFRRIEQKALAEVALLDHTVIATGGGTPCFFDNMELMLRTGHTCYIRVPTEVLLERLEKAKSRRPLLRGKSCDEIRAFIEHSLCQRQAFYERSAAIIDEPGLTNPQDLVKICEIIYNHLGK